MIGGVIVGMLAGSPLQVSGPAAGLAVIVFELVRDKGLSALGPILLLAGLIQLIAGVMKLGGWFRAISPAVVHGMLAGIGVLIVIGQFHVLFDAKPLPNGPENLAAMPGRLLGLSASNIAVAELAFAIGLLTIGAMLGWERFRPAALKLVPGALVGGLGTVFGPMIGAAVIVAMENYLASLGAWVLVVQGVIFVVCVLAFREGIVGVLSKLLKKPL
jgi:MFS superfamily sulfate permease-like transporter